MRHKYLFVTFTLMLLISAFMTVFLLIDHLKVMTSHEIQNAEVVDCIYAGRNARNPGNKYGSGTRARRNTMVVKTDPGLRIELRETTSHCQNLLNQKVSVFINTDDPADSRINSFSRFWLPPLATGGMALFFGFLAYRNMRAGAQRKNGA